MISQLTVNSKYQIVQSFNVERASQEIKVLERLQVITDEIESFFFAKGESVLKTNVKYKNNVEFVQG